MKKSQRIGSPSYSYNKFKTQEKVLLKRLLLLGGLTVIIILVIWFWGLTFVRILGALATSEAPSNETTQITEPLRQPTVFNPPELTNNERLTLSGLSSGDALVTLYVNGDKISQVTADGKGEFKFVDIPLKEGLNLFKLVAERDSQESAEEKFSITLDKTVPNLQIIEPKNGQRFDKDTSTVVIKGVSEKDASVFVNSIQTPTDQDGGFTYNLSLIQGETEVEIKAIDKAGNEAVEKLKLVKEN